MGPLTGIRVLDLSRILAGPWATQLLADLGADVLKVERPGQGDDTRQWGPPYLKDADGIDSSESAYFLAANRGKRSLAIDFQHPDGADLIRRLSVQSHIFVENFKVGGLAKVGLDFATLNGLNKALVYCSITGYGQTGPYAHRAGYDAAIQAQGGLMGITGEADDAPGGGPQKVGVAVADLMAGMYASVGILAALRHAESSGEGQHIDLALFDTQVGWLANQAMNYLIGGDVPQRRGTAHPNIVPYQVMPASDGCFMLAVGNDAQFQRLCEVIEESALAKDPRFTRNADRVAHRIALVEILTTKLKTRGVSHWLPRLEAATVPCAAVNALDQVFADPQLQSRGMRIELPHPLSPALPMVASPLRLSVTPVSYSKAPPQLGADTRNVLAELLGLDAITLDRLQAVGVIGS